MTPSHLSCQTLRGTHAVGQVRTTGDLRKGPPKRGRDGASRGVLAVPTPTAGHANDTRGTGRDSDILATRPRFLPPPPPEQPFSTTQSDKYGVPQYRPSPTTDHVKRRRGYPADRRSQRAEAGQRTPSRSPKATVPGVVSAGLPHRGCLPYRRSQPRQRPDGGVRQVP